MNKQLPTILVTGADGQVASEISALSKQHPAFHFLFLSKADLPIHQLEQLHHYFEEAQPAYCINCAAYTAVDKAETEKELALLVNAKAVGLLASVCALTKTRLIHISTDYVFDGTASVPYTETSTPHPVNYYGLTKLEGERLCLQNNPDSLIIRTAWVYSSFGNNFVKTMLHLMRERVSINVVNDQYGTPTYAADLAACILTIINQAETNPQKWQPGIYHYSNEGVISWYDFALAIKKYTGSLCTVNPIGTKEYPTPAKRPSYSVFDKEKIKKTFELDIPDWQKSLAACLRHLGGI